MQRFQASWLVETIMDNITDLSASPSWFFPCVCLFSPMEWLAQRNTRVIMNVPVHSQAMLFKSWFSKSDMFPQEDILKAFNQILMKNIDININPFKGWLDTYFTKQQLDYLLYWREAANELNDEALKGTFLAIVSQVINYWLANNRVGLENTYKPDEILAFYYKRYRGFRDHLTDFKVTEQAIEGVKAEECSTVVFNLVFGDEDYLEDESQIIYNAWLNGYTDLEESRRNFSDELKRYVIELNSTKNFDFFKKMSENAKSAAFCWSGKGITPNFYQRTLITPLEHLMADRYQHSKLVYKCIDTSTDAYDYILLCY